MARGDAGTIFVGSRAAGNVYALVDADGDGTFERVFRVAEGLNLPSGVAFRAGALYVAEVHRVIRFDGIEDRLENPPDPVVIRDDFPSDLHHGWKFIAFGPDDMLYVPVGAPCNVCPVSDRYGTIMRMRPDGSQLETVARGVRNSVGFDWDPLTQDLWFTDNGRDLMGDDRPGDELNHVTGSEQHFGFPFCHAGGIQDGEFDERPCSEFVAPAQVLDPHVAAIGMRFYTASAFPPPYHNQIFIAEHGSWNRTAQAGPIGYRITVVSLEGGSPVAYEVFADGWLGEDGEAWGRPADVLVMPDGSLLVSDDQAGAVYRIAYREGG